MLKTGLSRKKRENTDTNTGKLEWISVAIMTNFSNGSTVTTRVSISSRELLEFMKQTTREKRGGLCATAISWKHSNADTEYQMESRRNSRGYWVHSLYVKSTCGTILTVATERAGGQSIWRTRGKHYTYQVVNHPQVISNHSLYIIGREKIL